jgi:predicted ATPase
MLGRAPGVKLLVTSRARLNVSGEHVFRLGPLDGGDAARLFALRARAAGGELDPASAGELEAVCDRLERVPLALELAAAQLRVFSLGELLAHLDQRISYLTGGPRDAPERQQTLRATLDWSYELLPPGARELLAALSVFHGGFTQQSAWAVCAPQDSPRAAEFVDALGVLVDHSLVYRAEQADGTTRFQMLETIREYAAHRLTSSDDPAGRHARHFVEFAERANDQIDGPDQAVWLARMKVEHDNFNAALAWALDGHDLELGVALAAALGQRYYWLAGHRREGACMLERVLACQPPASDALARLLTSLAVLARHWDSEAALRHAERARAIATRSNDPKLGAWCTLIHALVLDWARESQGARELYEQAAKLAKSCGDRWVQCAATINLANLALLSGDYHRASRLATDALATAHHLDPISAITIHCVRCVAEVRLGRNREAVEAVRDGLHHVDGVDAAAVVRTGWIRACASVAARAGSAERSARLFGHDELICETNGLRLDPAEERDLHDAHLILRAKLYPDVLASAWQHGRSISSDQAVAEVVEEFGGRPAERSAGLDG